MATKAAKIAVRIECRLAGFAPVNGLSWKSAPPPMPRANAAPEPLGSTHGDLHQHFRVDVASHLEKAALREFDRDHLARAELGGLEEFEIAAVDGDLVSEIVVVYETHDIASRDDQFARRESA